MKFLFYCATFFFFSFLSITVRANFLCSEKKIDCQYSLEDRIFLLEGKFIAHIRKRSFFAFIDEENWTLKSGSVFFESVQPNKSGNLELDLGRVRVRLSSGMIVERGADKVIVWSLESPVLYQIEKESWQTLPSGFHLVIGGVEEKNLLPTNFTNREVILALSEYQTLSDERILETLSANNNNWLVVRREMSDFHRARYLSQVDALTESYQREQEEKQQKEKELNEMLRLFRSRLYSW